MTKAYTLNRLINEVSAVNYRDVKDFTTFASAVSPIAGTDSVKIQVLNNFLFGELGNVLKNTSFGKTPRTRVLTALRLRKKNNF